MEIKYPQKVINLAKNIKMVLTDVDGVLTDGSMNYFTTPGEDTVEIKKFSAYDGISFHMLRDCGIKTGIITGGNAPATAYRAAALGMDYLYYNFFSKQPAFEDILKRSGIRPEQVAFIGDDFIDIPVLRRVGMACCVSNGRPEIAQMCHYVTQAIGGQGAFREVAEMVLKAQGFWDKMMENAEKGTIGHSRKNDVVIVDYKDLISG